MRYALVYLGVFALRMAAQPNVSAWEMLMREFSDSDPDRRKQAVLAIGSIGPAPEVIKVLDQALRDKEVPVRQTTAALIGQMKYRDCIPALRAALDDDPEVAVQAAKSLWDMGDFEGRPVLERLYTGQEKGGPGFFEGAMRDAKDKLRHPSKLVTMGVNEASGALLGPFSMGILVAQDMLKDSGAPGRALAAEMLSTQCDFRAFQLMEWSLENDRNNMVRAASAKALGKCGNIATINKLMLLLADNSMAVRDMAAASVVRLTIEKLPKAGAESQAP